jgi:hypothetical protein
MDKKDRLIISLVALLKAERETRSLLIEAIADQSVSRDALLAMLSDPIPVVTHEDLQFAERLAAGNAALTENPRQSLTRRKSAVGRG